VIHPGCELRFVSAEVGDGVFATEFIPRGTVLWVLDEFDRVLTPADVDGLVPSLRAVVEKYAYLRADGSLVLCWDLGRYMNHSCTPTTRGVGECFEVAIRDVNPGDELTCDYGTLNLTAPLLCRCGTDRCRGVIRSDDPVHLAEGWDEEAAAAFALAPFVPQPLLPFAKVDAADRPLLEAIQGRTVAAIPSALQYYFAPRDGGS
jgi:uncharacterized protein